MKKVKTKDLQAGMIVAQTVYKENGQVFIKPGLELTESIIDRLKNMEREHLLIDDGILDSIDSVPEAMLFKTKAKAKCDVKNILAAVRNESRINLEPIYEEVESLLEELLNDRSVLAGLYFFMSIDDKYQANHAVKVCLLSIIIGLKMGYNREQLHELGLGAILHDIGMLGLDQDVLNKPDKLSEQEFEEIKTHTENGFEFLQQQDSVMMLAKNIALQHHERWNGSGYPGGLKGFQIHEYARIVAVADVFSALNSDRPYRAAFEFDEALEYITTMSNYYFDPKIVAAFLDSITKYPPGTIVLLNSRIFARVTEINQQIPTRPKVQIILDQNKQIRKEHNELNLYQHPGMQITRVLNEKEKKYFFSRLNTQIAEATCLA